MNCKRVEQLIPLYAGGDTDPKLTAELRSHLKTCGDCAGLAGEYEASRAWLSSTIPEFDEAILADVKRVVLQELREPDSSPGLFELISSVIARVVLRPAVAAALLLIVFGALGFWLYLPRSASPVPIQSTNSDPQEIAPVPGGRDAPAPVPSRRPPLENKRRKLAIARMHRVKQDGADSRQALTQNSGATGDAQSPSALAVESSGMLRIDIQTGDPNIRIIWFAPRVDGPQTNP